MANESDSELTTGIGLNPEVPLKKNGFSVSRDPVIADPEESGLDGHKYEVTAGPAADSASHSPAYEDLGTLPATYGEETLFLVARDPRWLFSYWDIDWTRYSAANMRYGFAQFFLKIFRADGHQETLVEINPTARNWYVPVHQPDCDYAAELGYFDQAGAWRRIATSEAAHTPPDSLAPETDSVDFATVPAHLTFDRLLSLVQERMAEGETLLAALSRVAGEGRARFDAGSIQTWGDEQKRLLAALLGDNLINQAGMSSDQLDTLIRKQLGERLHSEAASGLSGGFASLLGELAPSTQSLFSAIGASWSAQPFSVHAERGFYMHVNAEIIFYGGTHPDAAVTVDGKSITLKPDGSFRYHFTLPDGDFHIPIIATSPDKVEQRSATLSFTRGTLRVGHVDSTGQPPELNPLIGRKN